MDERGETVTLARRAYSSRDWPTAAKHFDTVDAEHLTANDLAAYAEAAWWVGRVEDKLRLVAAACDAFEAEARPVEAAMVSVQEQLPELTAYTIDDVGHYFPLFKPVETAVAVDEWLSRRRIAQR